MLNKRKVYDDNFKEQIVNMYKNGEPVLEIIRDYNISRANDNRTEKRNDLIRLSKEEGKSE